jgi:hypothetical protein
MGDVDKVTHEVNVKLDRMVETFQSFMPPEEKEIGRLVALKGGSKACREDDKLLRELNDFEQKMRSPTGGGSRPGHKAGGQPSDFDDLKDDPHVNFDDLKHDVQVDPDVAIENNMSVFSRKFEVQKQQILDELVHVVVREGDRVINRAPASPHETIIDPVSTSLSDRSPYSHPDFRSPLIHRMSISYGKKWYDCHAHPTVLCSVITGLAGQRQDAPFFHGSPRLLS